MNQNAFMQRVLLIYSGVLTIVLCVMLLSGAGSPAKKISFDEIDVHRIQRGGT